MLIDLRSVAAVGFGAAFGGILRLVVTAAVVARLGATAAPYATLFINVSGSFAIGIVLEAAQLRADFHPLWRYFLATGILGGYTTFSTFSIEAFRLGTSGLGGAAVAYVLASVGLGIAAAFAGVAITRALAGAG